METGRENSWSSSTRNITTLEVCNEEDQPGEGGGRLQGRVEGGDRGGGGRRQGRLEGGDRSDGGHVEEKVVMREVWD